jgi:hypothetical protein
MQTCADPHRRTRVGFVFFVLATRGLRPGQSRRTRSRSSANRVYPHRHSALRPAYKTTVLSAACKRAFRVGQAALALHTWSLPSAIWIEPKVVFLGVNNLSRTN